MGIEPVKNGFVYDNVILPQSLARVDIPADKPPVEGSNNNFFHVLKDAVNNETYIFRTEHGHISGLVDHKDVKNICDVLNQQQYIKIEVNKNLPGYLQFPPDSLGTKVKTEA